MGSFSPQLNDFFALCGFTAFLFTYFPIKLRDANLSQNLETLFLLAVSVFVFWHGDTYKLIATSIFVFALSQMFQNLNRKEPELHVLLLTTIFYTIFMLLYQHISAVWLTIEKVPRSISHLITAFMPYPVDYGVTYMGLKITVAISLFCFTVLFFTDKRKIFRFALLFISLIITNIFYVIFHSYILFKIRPLYPFLYAKLLNLQFILFLFLLSSTYIFMKQSPLKSYIPSMPPKKLTYSLLIATLALLSVQGFYFQSPQLNMPGKIVFHDEGHVDWDLPVFDRYGGKKGGMFGVLLNHLRAIGYEVAVGVITRETLNHAETLVLINSNRIFTQTEKQFIWNFVKKGGSLLVLGDHTGVDSIRKPFNNLLSPANISFNFDSAISLVPKWTYGFEFQPHYINKNIRDENDLQIWIGASLDIAYPARPVIIGKYAFSDQGDLKARDRGYLGDMRYSQGEQLGDPILVAENRYGNGKILVFGDTSPFQNSALFQSSQFVDRVFEWLSLRKIIFYPYDRLLMTIIFLALIMALLSTQGAYRKIFTIIVFILLGSAILTIAIPQFHNTDEKMEIKEKIAIIDASHLERINLDSWGEPDGFGGLSYNFMRNGYYPQVLKTFDSQRILDAEILVVIAPAKPFNEKEVKVITEYVRRGGYLILTVGWEEKASCRRFLQQFKLDLENIPLGQVAPSQNLQGLSLYGAWPVTYGEKDTEVLCRVWNYPVAVLKRHGRGAILFVGDSSFLLNKNLEGLYNYSISNIMFLKNIIGKRFSAEGEM